MYFNVQSHDEKFFKKIYNQSMKELNDFFCLNWKKDKPKIFLVKDRKSINQLMEQKTPDWLVGWNDGINVFILDKENYEKESSHTYSDDEYSCLIKHELVHVFTQVYSGIFDKSIEPDWLWEGIALYLSGQNKFKNKPKQLKNFLRHYSQKDFNSKVYEESGFAAEFLIKKFGKKKILKLIKSLKEINSKKEFVIIFKKIYGFELDYKNFQ